MKIDARTRLVEEVKAIGQEIIDRAEDIVGEGDLVSDLILTASFHTGPDIELPSQQRVLVHPLLLHADLRGGTQMNSILSDLYHGELRPNERYYPDGSQVGILLESFQQDEKWLAQLLDGKAKERMLELINIHDELIGAMTYDSFRDGSILGARLIMEVVGGQAGGSEQA